MMYQEDDFLQLSGIQHFAVCRRQWSLIHIEMLWAENYFTTDGSLLHERAHDGSIKESRGDIIVKRGVRVSSATLGVSGECDLVEFRRIGQYEKYEDCETDKIKCLNEGIALKERSGLWQPYPVEYKRGSKSGKDGDRLQLCGQAMCLEEMLLCKIPKGALYFADTRHREEVVFDDELRIAVRKALSEMHDMYKRRYTPKVRPTKLCSSCSMKELCLPKLLKATSVKTYIAKALEED